MTVPRGIRLNNPGNIRLDQSTLPGHIPVHWLGQSEDQPDGVFVKFDKPEYGIRSIVRIMRSYRRLGINTVSAAINRYSPPSENDTKAYVAAVCKGCAVEPDQVIDLNDIMPQLIGAIIWQENGDNPYTPDQIATGIALA